MQELRSSTTGVSFVLLAWLAGCHFVSRSSLAPEPPAVRPSELGGMHNVSVSGVVWIGGHPDPDDLDLAQRRGVSRVIDVSSLAARSNYDLWTTCKELGLRCFEIGVRSADDIPDAAVDQVVRLLGEGEPTLLFSEDGSTAALFFAIHRVVNEGVELERALLEAKRSGMASGRPEAFVRAQVTRLGAEG